MAPETFAMRCVASLGYVKKWCVCVPTRGRQVTGRRAEASRAKVTRLTIFARQTDGGRGGKRIKTYSSGVCLCVCVCVIVLVFVCLLFFNVEGRGVGSFFFATMPLLRSYPSLSPLLQTNREERGRRAPVVGMSVIYYSVNSVSQSLSQKRVWACGGGEGGGGGYGGCT